MAASGGLTTPGRSLHLVAITQIAVIALSLLGLFELAHAHPKTDVIKLANGDVLTGEIKGMSRAQLTLSTDPSPDKIYLKWEWVAEVTSKYLYEVEDEDGLRYFGTLAPGDEAGRITVRGVEGADESLLMFDVVSITPINKTFWSRLSGDAGLGFGYSQANTVVQWSANGTVTYVSRKWTVNLQGSSFFSSQENAAETIRNWVSLEGTRNLPERLLVVSGFKGEQNPDQGYDPRFTIWLGGGRFLVKENHQILSLALAVSGVSERSVGGADYETSSELSAPLNLQRFFYERPKRDLTVNLTPSVSLNDLERYRLSFSATGRWETIKNLYIELTLQESYDARPPGTGDAAKNDLTITTGVSYSFP